MLRQQQQRRRLAGVLVGLRCGGASSEDDGGVAVVESEAVEVALPAALAALQPEGQDTLVIRAATADDINTLDIVTNYGFASPGSRSEILERDIPEDPRTDSDATWGAFVGDRAVSQLLAHPWALGGGASCKVAAVSGVGTLPEFRRLGLLRSMMSLLFKDMMEKGQALAALGATQAAIYQRYGYAEAVRDEKSYTVDPVDIAFVDGDGGSCIVTRHEPSPELEPVLKPLYEQFIEGRACAYGWGEASDWSSAHAVVTSEGDDDRPWMSDGPQPYVAVATDASGEPCGYMIYTTGSNHDEGTHPTRFQRIAVREIIYSTLDAYRSFWSFLKTHDLVGEVKMRSLPSDDPAPNIFLEPRLLRPTVSEGSWWRIVDVVGALEGRSYRTELGDSLVLEVKDDERLAPWNTGSWTLQIASDGSATLSKASPGAAEISVGIAELTSLWSGAVSAAQLHSWGMLEAADEKALAKADYMLATGKQPWCCDGW